MTCPAIRAAMAPCGYARYHPEDIVESRSATCRPIICCGLSSTLRRGLSMYALE